MIELEQITIKEAVKTAEGNEELLKKKFRKFRLWFQQQMHFPQEISDKQLQKTILTSKFDMRKAKKRIDSLYILRPLIPEFFGSYNPLGDDVTRLYETLQWVILPKLSPEKYRVHILRFLKDENSLYSLTDVLKYAFMLMDLRAEEDTVNSDVVIWDCLHLTINHLLHYTPSTLKKYNLCLKAYGTRCKAIYVINAPTYFDQILKIIKMVITPKLYERISVYSSGMESLKEIMPKSILPANYDGDELSMETLTDMWRAKLEERNDWFLKQGKLKTHEFLRKDRVINTNELFGVFGTFRKLNID